MSFLGKTLGKIVSTATSVANGGGGGGKLAAQTSAASQPQSLGQAASTSAAPSSATTTQSRSATTTGGSHLSSQFNQDAQLTLTHLRKLFYEYMHPKQADSMAALADRDEKLYSILPLFIKTFGHVSLADIGDRFPEASDFCLACTHLLCSEISKRVQDDLVLVRFFEIKTTDDCTDGSGLLNTVNLLASGPVFLVEIMTRCALPSRLVMCIYLFICLPEPKDSLLDHHHAEFSAKERRILFQKCFQQLLIKLCQHACTCDELCDADSLRLLFKIVASTCEQHNVPWRQTAANALLTLTKAFTSNAVAYIQHAQCIQTSLQCMEGDEICSGNLLERFQLMATLITFLRETCFLNNILLDEFRHANGYKTIADMCLRLEREDREETRLALKNLIYCVEEFVAAGCSELKLSAASVSATMFKIEGFQMPQPSPPSPANTDRSGRTVRNIYAFQCLINIFNRAQNFDTCVFVLESIRSLYKKDDYNYFILESQNLVLYSLDGTSIKIQTKTNEVQVKFIEILEFITFTMKLIPCKELVSIGLSIQNYK